MIIAMDAIPFLYTRTGIGYAIAQILKQFLGSHPEHDYLLPGMRNMGRDLVKKCEREGMGVLDRIRPVPFPFRKVSRYYFEWISTLSLRRERIDLFWGPNFRGVFSNRFPTVITIHDLTHIHYPEFRDQTNAFLKAGLPGHARRAALVLADSQATKKDIVESLGVPENKVKVVHLGVDSTYFHPIHNIDALNLVKKSYSLSDHFILFVGTLQPRKNIEGLIEAFRILRERDRNFTHDLVIVGCKGWQYSEIFNRISQYGLQNRVKWIGYVDYGDLPALYSMADLFVLPSHYEGFGLPVLEAMACGTPVITSNVSSLPEVAGDAAVLIDPKSPEMIADNIYKVLMDSDLNKQLREKGLSRAKEFSWEKCASEIMDLFESVVQGKA